ncbi:MAG: orotidine-5'-phosphate decarboxylase [Pseudobutyrivibrio sp.]|nr:orotidine-5'-phosphate decarboxylase [Pseudobutyrivibrio sp.]
MITKLIEQIQEKKAPIVVGLDPTLKLMPKTLVDKWINELGQTPEAVAEAMFEYNRQIMDACVDLIPAVKPQIAMYETFGIPGLYAYQRTVEYAKQLGLIVIADIKRGDIGTSSAAYALGHLGSVKIGEYTYRGFDADMATVNPYMGSDSVRPFVDVCKPEDKGIFVLCKTSNPSSGEFQDRIVDGRPLYEHVAEKIEEWGANNREGDYSNVGAVVGATYPEMGERLRKLMPHTYILVPGYGAQGGKGADLKNFFNKDGLGAIVNSSRGIIAAFQKEEYAKYGEENFALASRAAVVDMLEDINSVL